MDVEKIISNMTLEEKADYVGGEQEYAPYSEGIYIGYRSCFI